VAEGESSAAPSLAYRVREAAAVVRARTPFVPKIGLILGSGLGELADEVADPVVVPYDQIPHFPRSTVQGHAGQLVLGQLGGASVVVMRGRAHFYEGYTMQQVTFPVRVMRRLGIETLLVTNAAGAVNPTFAAGDLMVISDHINFPGFAGHHPLLGLDEPELGVRFLSLLSAYAPGLRALAFEVAAGLGIPLKQGVYAYLAGPTFETLAELRLLQRLGADAVGMSTVPEVIVARHEEVRVLGLTVITNSAVSAEPPVETSHAEVLAMAERLRPQLGALIKGILARLAEPRPA
jgi:purine-nucleoside phosphorylase